MSLLTQDTTSLGSRGTPNAWSPATPSGGNWIQQRGIQQLDFGLQNGIYTLQLEYRGGTTLMGALSLGSDSELPIEVVVNAQQGAFNNDIIGLFCCYQDTDNFYCADLTSGIFEIRKNVGGLLTQIAVVSMTTSISTRYGIRFQNIGGVLKARVWDASTTEPSSWTLTVTDTDLGAGLYGICGTPTSFGPGEVIAFDSYSANDTQPGQRVTKSAPVRFVYQTPTQTIRLAPVRFNLSTPISIPWNSLGLSKAIPKPLTLISRGVPAYTNDDYTFHIYPAARAVDNDYGTFWNAAATPTSGAPIYIALDLSGVPTAQRQTVLFHWINDAMSGAWDPSFISVNYYNCPKTYTIDVNTAPGGSLPTTGWTTLVTETGNPYHSREYVLHLNGANWVRMNVTDINGSSLNMGVACNLEVFDLSTGGTDMWAFAGDSITQQGMLHDNTAGGTWAQLVNSYVPQFFPCYDSWGIGGITSTQALTGFSTWLAQYPGTYVSLNYGTNDANNGAGNYDTTYQANIINMITQVLNAGKIPVLPTVPYGLTTNLLANVSALNVIIRQLYQTYPQVIQGPDMYAFYSANPGFISGDGIHPTLVEGYSAWRQLWVNAMLTNVYVGPPFTPSPSPAGGAVPGYSGPFTPQPVLHARPLPIIVNGVMLTSQPTTVTSPGKRGQTLYAGSTFTLLFQGADSTTLAAVADGTSATLTFALPDRTLVTTPVRFTTRQSGATTQVDVTLLSTVKPK